MQLGQDTAVPASPQDAELERVSNPHADTNYVARFTAPEFTSLCPVTGQPDFAQLVIDYVPGDWLVESKSLKLYLGSFRNHGAFHEDCTVAIGKQLVALLDPRWLRIGGYWYPPWRHSDRRILANRRGSRGYLAPGSGRPTVPRTRLTSELSTVLHRYARPIHTPVAWAGIDPLWSAPYYVASRSSVKIHQSVASRVLGVRGTVMRRGKEICCVWVSVSCVQEPPASVSGF